MIWCIANFIVNFFAVLLFVSAIFTRATRTVYWGSWGFPEVHYPPVGCLGMVVGAIGLGIVGLLRLGAYLSWIWE